MTTPRVLVMRSPGTNCDVETAYAFDVAGGQPDRIHINRLLEQPARLAEYQILCVPGGFSYGDDLAAGRILAAKWRSQLNNVLTEFRERGKLILGICNGFQVLVQTGVLLDDNPAEPAATLTRNEHGRFEDRWVHLVVDGSNCVFLQGIERLELPIAHAEGKFVARSGEILHSLKTRGQLVLRYARADGGPEDHLLDFPTNPNGSQMNVAGISDASGRVFGLMPHPERFTDATHHPQWTRRPIAQPGQGLRIFQNAVAYFR